MGSEAHISNYSPHILFRPAACVLQVMHEVVGGVHMDMKPQQLLIDDTGHGKVNDFNSIHLMNTQPGVQGAFCPTQAGQPVRMVPWRSPENVAGKVRRHKNS